MSDAIDELRAIVARLRAPDGCPWDREQTHSTLRAGLIEEAYEVIDAIDRNDDLHLSEELGDFLLQVVMHCQIAQEENRFDLDRVARGISEKLIRRHPHVFGDAKADDSAAVLKQWDQIKQQEKGKPASSTLDGVPGNLPALMRAEKAQKKAAKVGFDWDDAKGVLAKVREELDELEREMAEGGTAVERERELGDLLFSVVNLARKLKVEPELALAGSTEKFIRRFKEMESRLVAEGRRLESCTMPEMDAVWDAVKADERKRRQEAIDP